MAKKINWRSFFADMIGVLIGITVAFQLQNWKENRASNKLESQYLTSMSSDLSKDSLELTGLIDTMQHFTKNGGLLIRDVIRRDFEHDSIFKHFMSMFAVTKFDPFTTTYQSMVSSGDISLIDNYDLRNDIADLYQRQHSDVRDVDISHLDTFYDFIYPYINKEVSFAGASQLGSIDFMKKNEFTNLAFANNAMLNRQNSAYQETLDMTLALKRKIDSTLN